MKCKRFLFFLTNVGFFHETQGRIFILFEQHDIAFPRPKRRWVVYIIGKNRKFVNCAYHVLFLIDLLVKALAIYFHFGHVIYYYQLWQFSEVLT